MTTQTPDRLRFNRRVHKLFSEPLESYFDDHHVMQQLGSVDAGRPFSRDELNQR